MFKQLYTSSHLPYFASWQTSHLFFFLLFFFLFLTVMGRTPFFPFLQNSLSIFFRESVRLKNLTERSEVKEPTALARRRRRRRRHTQEEEEDEIRQMVSSEKVFRLGQHLLLQRRRRGNNDTKTLASPLRSLDPNLLPVRFFVRNSPSKGSSNLLPSGQRLTPLTPVLLHRFTRPTQSATSC